MSDKDAREEAQKRFEVFAARYWEGRIPGPVPIFAKTIDGLYIHERIRTGFEDMSDRWRSRYNSACERLNRLTRWRFFSRTELPEGMSERLDGEWVKFSEVVAALEGKP